MEPKAKRVYAKRRDWRKEMEDLARYCQMAIEFIAVVGDRMPEDDDEKFWAGQTAALKNVLARIERKP